MSRALGILLGQRNPLRRRRAGGGVGAHGAVTFPTTNLVTRVQIALGADLSADPGSWNWADITNYVRHDLGISLTTGRRDESTHVSTGMAQMKLDNRDGRFTRRNPNSPYYGLLSKNTPIWATVDAGSGEKTRLEMFVNEWPKRWSDKSGTDSTVTIQCAGVMRRLAQGTVAKSALRRAITFASPVAYWPCEEGPDASELSSGLIGGPPLKLTSPAYVNLGSVPAAGSALYAEFVAITNLTAGGVEQVDLTSMALGSTKLSVTLVMTGFMPSPAITTHWHLARIDTTATPVGTPLYISAYCGTTGGVVSTNYGIDVAYDGSNRAIHFAQINPFDGEQHSLVATWEQVGADVRVTMSLDGTAGTPWTATAKTLGTPTTLTLLQPQTLSFIDTGNNTGGSVGLGHLAVWGNVTPLDPYEASTGYVGELPHVRIARLCAEEGIPFSP